MFQVVKTPSLHVQGKAVASGTGRYSLCSRYAAAVGQEVSRRLTNGLTAVSLQPGRP
jgi:hypothetical protein